MRLFLLKQRAGMVLSVVLTGIALTWVCNASVAAEPQPETVRETHGDWAIRCSAARPGDCYMVQLGYDAAGNPMAEFSLVRFGEGRQAAAGATIIVPLGTALPEGLALSVDGGEVRHYIFDVCTPAGCAANIALPDAQVAALKRGARANIAFVPIASPDRTVSVSISLSGFTKAYEALR
ncbi:invasion associated locus B family protein [Rhodospirillaceae bacterium KN72]|uniref:Invasion associated locus B family protein n=1 Tax=Pacificispira spongiicola TaxID=2729598 RepID=A0A7Y0DWP0_9PROT|nr:invasion associated locus B family protein [Pacificispira spongiicola]NMM42888.1 invasion associated locus B family protein [Pacificispira spongiicola]